ncbi:unnamed protein product [Trifolium pratense]|uniref:Uncharacterized protein n=1 Tax=Trifolium pratense TaxID=57577 RepID=A0ACB0JJ53_TRIPR|nr:unnamed protein product [Trifolium pratense]
MNNLVVMSLASKTEPLLMTTMGGKLKFPFTIKDLSANVVDCCLWDNLAAHFIDYLKIRTDSGPIVVIVKHAHLKLAENNYPLQVTNAWNGTFLLINDDIPPINDFKNRLPADNTFAIQKEKFILGHPVMKIKDIIKLPKDKICVIVGTTSHIRDGHPTDDPILRYKIDIQIFDGDDSGKFIFWDSTCIGLLGKSSQLRQQMLDDIIKDDDEKLNGLRKEVGENAYKCSGGSFNGD